MTARLYLMGHEALKIIFAHVPVLSELEFGQISPTSHSLDLLAAVETKAAPTLRIHRNTLARTLRELDLNFRALRKAERRPVRGADLRTQKKIASGN
jgi:hypothetical protein